MIEIALATLIGCATPTEVKADLTSAGYEFLGMESAPVRGGALRLHYVRRDSTAQPAMALVVVDTDDSWCVRSVGHHDAWAYRDGKRRKAERER